MNYSRLQRLDPIARFVIAGFRSGHAQRYGMAIAAVLLAALLRGGASFLSERALLFPTFYPAVLAATLYGGVKPGLLASLASVLVVWSIFISRDTYFPALSFDELFNMAFFVAMAVLLVWITASYRGLLQRLTMEDDRRNLLVMEMQHRNRNTLAVAQSIVSQGLKDDRESAKSINGRLSALAKANELLMASPELAVPLTEIVRSVMSSYDSTRYDVSGYPLVLRDNQARNMGLILHELTTNAAKYGALSSNDGRVSILCTKLDDELTLTWQEHGGPQIITPTAHGFGTRFIDRLLADLRASAERTYRPDGFVFQVRMAAANGPGAISSAVPVA